MLAKESNHEAYLTDDLLSLETCKHECVLVSLKQVKGQGCWGEAMECKS